MKKKSFDYFYTIMGDYDEAKKMAAAEFLEGYLMFNSEDMIDLNITDKNISAKHDVILYTVVAKKK